MDDAKLADDLAVDVESAETIELHSGDREPGATLNAAGKRVLIAALQEYAQRHKAKAS